MVIQVLDRTPALAGLPRLILQLMEVSPCTGV